MEAAAQAPARSRKARQGMSSFMIVASTVTLCLVLKVVVSNAASGLKKKKKKKTMTLSVKDSALGIESVVAI